uniref:Uncharacterized protein n=1 Tax=Physcomitrium patens TaxID=3218 RepID=A0A2K1KES6_PHYPA|nr:hypothetical protein PHYPA_008623 [Physcomitrium patens]
MTQKYLKFNGRSSIHHHVLEPVLERLQGVDLNDHINVCLSLWKTGHMLCSGRLQESCKALSGEAGLAFDKIRCAFSLPRMHTCCNSALICAS